VRQQVAFYASTPNYRVLLEHHGFDALGRELSELMRRGELAAMAAKVPDGLLEEVTVTADFERLGGLLRRRYEGLLDRVSLYAPIPEGAPEARWREFVAAFRVAA
jgi:hypothetical protein